MQSNPYAAEKAKSDPMARRLKAAAPAPGLWFVAESTTAQSPIPPEKIAMEESIAGTNKAPDEQVDCITGKLLRLSPGRVR